MERFSSHRAFLVCNFILALFARHHHVLGNCLKLASSFLENFFFVWCAITKFLVLFLQQETRSITWKSSQRSCIGRACADAILNEKIRCDYAWTTLTGKHWKWQEKLQAHPPVETELCKRNRNVCSIRLGRKKKNASEQSSICSWKFSVEPRVQFAFKPVKPVILPKWKAPGYFQKCSEDFSQTSEQCLKCLKMSPAIFEHYRSLVCYDSVSAQS